MFDFGALPPEINSIRMYTGPGSGPMMAAAAAWNNLAAELSTTASAYQSVIAELTGGLWLGPSSAAMAAAAEPYVAWMSSTAAAAEHAAAQAMASAAAYEAAFAMTVPPPVIAANRAQLAALVATNFLGQNTPAIAATEAHYGEMWAQDAAAMYGYASSSASAATLHPLTSPAPTINPGGPGAQAAAVSHAAASSAQTAGLNGLVSNLPSTVQSLASPLAASSADPPSVLSSLDNFFNNSLVINIPNAVIDTAAWNAFGGGAAGILFGHTYDAGLASASTAVSPLGAGLGGGGVLAGTAAPAAGGFGGAPVLAGMGQASSVGKLSVPTAWSAATPVEPAAATLTGSGWTAPAEEGTPMTTLPAGMPAVASAGRAGYGMGPRYGVKPKVMPTLVVV
jgi:PPE-repeat protein